MNAIVRPLPEMTAPVVHREWNCDLSGVFDVLEAGRDGDGAAPPVVWLDVGVGVLGTAIGFLDALVHPVTLSRINRVSEVTLYR
jgi:hypothetical protein